LFQTLMNIFFRHPIKGASNWKDQLAVAEWPGLCLEGLICTVDKQDTTEKLRNVVGSGQGLLLDHQAPAICTGFHPFRRHTLTWHVRMLH
jgi:hypothetical protein